MVTSASDTDQELGSVLDALSDATTPVEDAVTPVDTGALDDALTGADGETDTEAAPQETDEDRAWRREYRQRFFQNTSERIFSALDGDPVSKDKLSSHERRHARRIEEYKDREVAAALTARGIEPTVDEEAQVFQEKMRLFEEKYPQLLGMDSWERDEYLKTNDEDFIWWHDLESWKRKAGIPPDADINQMRAVIQRTRDADLRRKAAEQAANAPPPPGYTVLDAQYDEFQRNPIWALLTDDEKDELDPDNFNQANPEKSRLAMIAHFHRVYEAAEARAPKEPTTADKARALQRRLPPGVTGGRAPGRTSLEQVTNDYLADPTNRQKAEAYFAASRGR